MAGDDDGLRVARANAFPDIKPGDPVRFRFREGGASGYELVEVTKLSAGSREIIAALIRWIRN